MKVSQDHRKVTALPLRLEVKQNNYAGPQYIPGVSCSHVRLKRIRRRANRRVKLPVIPVYFLASLALKILNNNGRNDRP